MTTTTLTTVLDTLAGEGRVWPCSGNGWLWTSDDRKDRERAAQYCQGCPALVACGQEADARGEEHGVWGGVDREARKPSGTDRHKKTSEERQRGYRANLLEQLADLAEAGRSWEDAARALGTSTATLQRRCHRMRITRDVKALFPNGWAKSVRGVERARHERAA